ncbi:hypothetical protein FQA39_LY11393 [Lamprigera yunnana]|nr:hypothetical protein FQA39_LY11393 [Lamprigera yunnana]
MYKRRSNIKEPKAIEAKKDKRSKNFFICCIVRLRKSFPCFHLHTCAPMELSVGGDSDDKLLEDSDIDEEHSPEKDAISEKEEEEEEISLDDSSDDATYWIPEVEPSAFEELDRDPEPDDFVLVQFKAKNNVFYVEKVLKLEKDTNDIEVNFLRKSVKFEGHFIFPPIPDITTVPVEDIKFILPPPSLLEHSNQTISTTKSLTENGNSESELSNPVYEDDDDDIEAKLREQEDLEKCVEETSKPIEDITSDDWIMVKFAGKKMLKYYVGMDVWTVEEVDELICLINSNSILYDMSLPGYSNRDVKDDVWCKVASRISNKNVDQCKAKWQLLRAGYRKRRNTYTPSGSGAKQKKQWAYYKQLSFLEPHLTERETTTNVNEANFGNSEAGVLPGTYYLQSDGGMIPSPVNSENSDPQIENCSVHLSEETEELDVTLVEEEAPEPAKEYAKKKSRDSMDQAFEQYLTVKTKKMLNTEPKTNSSTKLFY